MIFKDIQYCIRKSVDTMRKVGVQAATILKGLPLRYFKPKLKQNIYFSTLRCTEGWLFLHTDGWMERQTNKQTNKRTHEQTNTRTNKQTNKRTNEQTN